MPLLFGPDVDRSATLRALGGLVSSEPQRPENGWTRETEVRQSLIHAEHVVRRLRNRFPRLPYDAVHDATMDVLVEWHLVCGRSLPVPPTTLYRYAWRNAANTLRSEQRRRRREASWCLTRAADFALSEPLSMDWVDDTIATIEASLVDAEMRVVFRLWLSGERETAAFADALEMSDLAAEEQRRDVKRAKDRLKKHLRRKGKGLRAAFRIHP